MTLSTDLDRLGLKHVADKPYSRIGFWRIGGPIKHLVSVESTADIVSLYKVVSKLSVLGAGSNMLVADEGVSGLSIKLTGALAKCQSIGPDGVVVVGGGMKNTKLLNTLKREGLGGLGSLAGVPGTIGGAIRMNAGGSLGEICERVLRIECVDVDGCIKTMDAKDLGFAYRHCHGLPWGAIVTRVWLGLGADGFEAEQQSIAAYMERRKATQPLMQPSCGSTFTNPANDYAGRLIESVGLKGHRIGGAEFSTKHANFIINVDNALSMDVYQLMVLARKRVFDESGIILEPEVKPMGDWPEGMWPLS